MLKFLLLDYIIFFCVQHNSETFFFILSKLRDQNNVYSANVLFQRKEEIIESKCKFLLFSMNVKSEFFKAQAIIKKNTNLMVYL